MCRTLSATFHRVGTGYPNRTHRASPMKVAVITPYHEPSSPYLRVCIDSVTSQTHTDVFHVLIGDGCTLPPNLAHTSLHNIPLPRRLNNYGDSPRSIGVVYAF